MSQCLYGKNSVITNTAQTATLKILEEKTNVDDKPIADCAVNISEVLNDLTNRRYQGVQLNLIVTNRTFVNQQYVCYQHTWMNELRYKPTNKPATI